MTTPRTIQPRLTVADRLRRLPIIHQLRQSVGLQRGMLITGLVITGFFILLAIFGPLFAPYTYNQLRLDGQLFGA